MTHWQSRLMHEHISKHVKMHRKPTCGTNKHGKNIVAWSGKEERYARSNWHHGNASQVVTPKQGLMGVRYNHTTTNLLRCQAWQSLEQERLRQA